MTAPVSEAMQKPACNFDHASPSGADPFAADASVIENGLSLAETIRSVLSPRLSGGSRFLGAKKGQYFAP